MSTPNDDLMAAKARGARVRAGRLAAAKAMQMEGSGIMMRKWRIYWTTGSGNTAASCVTSTSQAQARELFMKSGGAFSPFNLGLHSIQRIVDEGPADQDVLE
jgi:hypothetical protein